MLQISQHTNAEYRCQSKQAQPLRVCRLPEMNPGNPGVSLLFQCQNRSARKGAKTGTLFWGRVPKIELEGRSKNGVQKCEEDEIKGSKSGAGSSEIY